MGKVFLLLIVVGFAWGAWSIWGHWKKTFHLGDEVKPASMVPVTAPQPVVQPPRAPTEVSDAPEKVICLARTQDSIMIKGEGLIKKGQEIFTGWVVLSWDAAGVWISKAGKAIRVRYERAGEAATRIAQEMADVQSVPVTASSVNPLGFMAFGENEASQ